MNIEKTCNDWFKENSLKTARCCASCKYMDEGVKTDLKTHDCHLAKQEITEDENCGVYVYHVCKKWESNDNL